MDTKCLKCIVSKCFDAYRELIADRKLSDSVIKGVIPILWFGDLEKYFKSEKRIITLGYNPSGKEFLSSGKDETLSISHRFPHVPLDYSGSESDFEQYIISMNEYFKRNPYKGWFRHYEKVLNHFDTSYYEDTPANTALHIDIFAPIATDPIWSRLTKYERSSISGRFGNFYSELFKVLNPDVVIVSANKFTKEEVLKLTEDRLAKGIEQFKGQIDVYHIHNTIYISGMKRYASPFSGKGMTDAFICKACSKINSDLRKEGIL